MNYYVAAVQRMWGGAAMTRNATETALAAANADWLPVSDVISRVRDAIDEVLGAIGSALGNEDRALVVSTRLGVPHGQLLTASFQPRIGGATGIRVTFVASGAVDGDYVTAERDNATSIEAYRDELANGEIALERYAFDLVDGRLFHTGASAAFEYVSKPSDNDVAAGLVPSRYNGTVIALAAEKLAILVAPSRVQGAGFMSHVAERGLGAIAQNQTGPSEADVREAAGYEGT